MTKEKLLALLALYEERLAHVPAARDFHHLEPLPHVRWMLTEMRTMAEDPAALDKFQRWLGFVQGVLWCRGIFTISEMREHNRNS